MLLNEGSKISFEAVKTDSLRPSYECLNFAKCIGVYYRKHKCFHVFAVLKKLLMHKVTPFSNPIT